MKGRIDHLAKVTTPLPTREGLRGWVFIFFILLSTFLRAQINTDRVMLMGRNALYYEDYVLSIQRFNMVINAKPYLSEPFFFRGLAKFYLEDFKGAEQDCSASLDRNPYVSNSYQLRGLCRVNLKDYEGAIRDYRKVIGMEPRNKPSWHNMVLCYYELQDYTQADSALDMMMRYWSRDAEVLTMKAQVSIAQGDTVRALKWVDSALEVDPYDGQAWTMRSMISLSRSEYAQAEGELDKAILQRPRFVANYINRALARFHQDNLRGAMADYDQALEIDAKNYIGHFNRGLLRAQVGDDNRAIEDFDYVLSVEPDNMIALYNRALLLQQTGDLHGAIRDISAVIDEYPEFWVGYQQRAAIRRLLGDSYGAERDEFKVLKARMDKRAGIRDTTAHKTRKQSDRKIEDYASLVEADENEPEHEYASAYRGRVQDRRVESQPQPLYVLSLHHIQSPTSRYIPYYSRLEQLNALRQEQPVIYLTNNEPQLSDAEMQKHFTALSQLNERIAALTKPDALLFLARAMEEYHVRDFEAALTDLDHAAMTDTLNAFIPFMSAQLRCRMMEAQSTEVDAANLTTRLGYARALDDLKRALQLAPDNPYAWYDLGNIHVQMHNYGEARQAYSRALNLDPRFPDAYYNRGLACILDGQLQLGLSDLSQAGEYGLFQAYNLIKRYSKDKR
ncbi:MAG: tetratricopeptide repeat protein [Bacteroidaceae bacterium]|nr:tetratricopeptide repeat protein [Bacteroidaceae bacterium]